MSDEFSFAAPEFNAEEALQRLKRDLRGLGLSERGVLFERRGAAIAKASLDGAAISAARVRRPSRSSPEWQARTLCTDAQLRDFVADLKKQLALWSDRDD